MRELVKVLRINGSYQHGHGALHDLVLKRRQPNRTLTPIGLGEPLPLHGRRLIPPTAQPLVQVPQVLLQVLGVSFRRHPVDPRRTIFARPVIRLA